MYVANLMSGYIVKRMPNTGSQHAPDCPSYDPPADLTGLGQLLGSAIVENPATGATTLKLDFSLTKRTGRFQAPSAVCDSNSAESHGTKLSLRGLLHYLWNQADLTRWHPGFAGKRTWATVRRHLLRAAEHKLVRGEALRARLYIPEPFSIDEREAIAARRLALWQQAAATPGRPQNLMLLIGEVKEVVPARYGFKAVLKHLPDQAFAIDEQLYRRLGRRFEPELGLWGASDDIHMVMIATFGVGHFGVPSIHELCLMPATREWLPVANGFEKQLLDRLVGESRSFVKGLQYNLGRSDPIASAALTDCERSVPMLFMAPADTGEFGPAPETGTDSDASTWKWRRSGESMPALPPPRVHPSRATPKHADRIPRPTHTK